MVLVNGGLEALAVVADFLPDVIFLDIGMPGMDGYQVAVALRRDARLEQTRIVALTAWGDSESRARASACGFDSYLVKLAALDSLLSEAATKRQHRP